MSEIILFFILGFLGALVNDILGDKTLERPRIEKRKIRLGFLANAIIGGVAGIWADGSALTAFLAGFSGQEFLERAIGAKGNSNTLRRLIVAQQIRKIAKEEGIDPELAVAVAECESKLDPTALHINPDGSRDRGLYQWNDKYHPEISDDVAFDIEKSTRAFCKAVKEGHLSWWNATKSCWLKRLGKYPLK